MATSGAKRTESSSWNDEHSQITVTAGSTAPTSDDSGVPTLPAATDLGTIAPSSSVVVVFPLVPVTATNSFGSSRQASSSSPMTGTPASRAAAMTGASCGTPGDLITLPAWGRSASPSLPSAAG